MKTGSIVLVIAGGAGWAAMTAGVFRGAAKPEGLVPVELARTNLLEPESAIVDAKTRSKSHIASFDSEKSAQARIVYIQLVRYKDTTPAHIEQLLRSAEQTFGKMPEVKGIRAGRIIRDSSKSYDYALIMEFDNMSDLTAYGNSEVHRQWVQQNGVMPLIQNHLMVTVEPLSPSDDASQ
jgi:Stress responsive A/B Barrel Domain